MDEYISVQAAAVAAGVSVQAVRDVLRDDARRAEILPRARKFGSHRGGIWMIHPDDVRAWQPRNYPRD